MNRWEEGFQLREHDHEYLEIVYVMAGEGFHYVGNRVERAAKGCLYVLPLGTSHIFRPSDASGRNKLVVYNLCIRPDFLGELTRWLSDYGSGGELFALLSGAPGTHLSLVDPGMELRPVFDRLFREYTEKPWGFEASMFAGLLQIAVQVTRLLRPDLSSASVASRTGTAAWLEYVDSHATEPLTVDELAVKAGISKRHFIRLFRQAAGMGFSDYMQLRRVEHACRMLLETDHKIASIAKSAGYQDPAHFREVFRKVMGTSPSEYRSANEK